MFLIRRAKPEDAGALLKLARTVHFINLPADKEIIDQKVSWSRQCFMLAAESDGVPATPKPKPAPGTAAAGPRPALHAGHGTLATGLRDLAGKAPMFMFVLEDLDNNAGVVGTSQIISKMGGPGRPNISLQLSRKEMFSQSLQVGVQHTIAQMYLDESGPTEIGGLILQHSYRGHRQKLGRLLSQVRFHFMGLHRQMFADRVLAEMMGPISADGRNPFWDYCTRCFINMTYDEADKFCQESKEFILTLFPHEPIYLTLIAPQARNVVGRVGPETEPAKRMLEKLGFKYHQRVDPFDGGPHLEAPTDEITLVANTERSKLAEPAKDDAELSEFGIVSVLDDDGEFRAVECPYAHDRLGKVIIHKRILAALTGEVGSPCGVTPTERPMPLKPVAPTENGKAKKSKKTSKK